MNTIEELMLAVAWKSAFLLIFAGAIALAMRKASSARRHAAWLVGLMGVILLPLVWSKAPSVEVPVPAQPKMSQSQSFAQAPTAVIQVPATATSPQYQAIVESATPFDWLGAFAICWAAASAFLLIRLLSNLNRVDRLIRASRPLEGDIGVTASTRFPMTRRVRFRVTDRLSVPATAGIFRPVVLIPTAALDWSEERLQMALTHELAHVKRLDWAWQVVAQLACAIHPLNPLAWFAASRLREESELACDDLVLAQGYNADQYAADLLDIAKGARLKMAMVVGMVRKPNVEARLRSIVSGKVSRKQVTGRALLGSLVLAVLIALPVAGLHLAASAQSSSLDDFVAEGYGQVVDPTGDPVAGAVVIAVFRDDMMGRKIVKRLADAHGKFDFRDVKVAGMRMSGLLAQEDGYGLGFTTPFNRVAPLQIQLSAPYQLKAQVLSTDGSPIAGVHVQPKFFVRGKFSHEFIDFPTEVGRQFEAVTDPNGIATLQGLPSGCLANFGVSDVAYCSTDGSDNVDLDSALSGVPVTITLHRSSTIEGRVTANGRPVANCQVMAQSQNQSSHSGWGAAVSGPDGRYRLERLRVGSYNVFIDGVGDLVGRAKEDVAIKEGQTIVNQDFELEKGGVVRGVVTDANGRPVPDFFVGVYGPARPHSSAAVQSCKTDAAGHYRLVVPEGSQDVYPMNGLQDHRDVEIATGETVTVNFTTPSGSGPVAIRGTVLDSSGKTAANATVDIVPNDLDVVGPEVVSGQTNSDGKFMIVAQQMSYPLTVRADRGRDGARVVVPKATKDIQVRLSDNVLVTASGRVVDPDGKPLADVNVNLFTWSHDRSATQRFVKSGPDGRFVIEGVWPNETIGVGANAPGYALYSEGPKLFPHGNTELGVIKLKAEGPRPVKKRRR